jgi:FkbH-like protein
MSLHKIKSLLLANDPEFWAHLAGQTRSANGLDELIFLSTLRKKASARGIPRPGPARAPLRIALAGGCSLYPLSEALVHLLEVDGFACEIFLGEFDNYTAELMEERSALHAFRPDMLFLLPGARGCKYFGALTDSRETVEAAAKAFASQLLSLCRLAHERSKPEILLCNFGLPARRDLGTYRSRAPGSDWTFRKWVNLELGLEAPPFVHICDFEHLANRHGALLAEDPRGWFESKQPCSPELLAEMAREFAHLASSARAPMKKVLVLDLDNTLWGGVVAEDGLEGIEIGDTSPRGEAFKAFQKYILSLKERGVLLAVCSKNDLARAMEPFEKHPEMALRPDDFVAFTANWQPKSDNLREMAEGLSLGLDSFVFVDDNPAEIEIVRQFTPAVATILLGPDPAEYVSQLQDCRLFEPRQITKEDAERSGQYRAEADRKALLGSASDMDGYLESLGMVAEIREFRSVDAPRLAQLINKSNQFNLTTRRRAEAEVHALVGQPDHVAFSIRLKDRFGDHGLISIVIARVCGEALEIDTWLMSCRVLKRQVEDIALNELARLARFRGCSRLEGVYLATAKNEMVRDFYPRMGFATRQAVPDRGEYTLSLGDFSPKPTRITLQPLSYDPK